MTRRLGATGASCLIGRRLVARVAAGGPLARAFGPPADGGSKAPGSIPADMAPPGHAPRPG